MMVGALVLPVMSVGITEASTPQALDAAHAQAWIDHGARVLAHLAGADRVIERVARTTGIGQQVGVVCKVGTRLDLALAVLRQCRRCEDLPHVARAAQQSQLIGVRAQVGWA